MKLLLDADVLLDIALDRGEFLVESNRVVEWCHEMAGSAVIAWHTVANVYYVLRSARGDKMAREFVTDLLRFSDVARGGSSAVRLALTLPMSDFEDALQVGAAVSAGAELIVTRNVRDYAGASLPALTPREFLRRI